MCCWYCPSDWTQEDIDMFFWRDRWEWFMKYTKRGSVWIHRRVIHFEPV